MPDSTDDRGVRRAEPAPWTGFLPLFVLPAAAIAATPTQWPRWAAMWTLAFAVFCGCKWLTWRRCRVAGASWSWSRHAGYFLAWPGLDAEAFLSPVPPTPREHPTRLEWALAAGKTLLGLFLMFAVARQVPAEYPYAVGWVGMLGIVLTLHFGSFHLLSCGWRQAGVVARPLMVAPLAATSIGEFWGRRWNTAFRDLTHRFLFRPLVPICGPTGAIAAGFLASGLVHDLVISLPAGGGYGGPTLFFLLQGGGLLFERSPLGRRSGLGRGLRGRIYTLGSLAATAPLLFHPPFVEGIVVPFLRALGAAP